MNTLFDPLLSSVFFAQAILNLLIIAIWNNHNLIKFHGVYQAEQKIHEGFIPRFGGLVMIVTLIFISFHEDLFSEWNTLLQHILWCLSALIVITFLEDIYNNILPLARLFFIFLSSVLVLTTGGYNLPVIDFPLISDVINHPWVLIILLTLALAAMVNAFNLIDGANGLLLTSFLFILACLHDMAGTVTDADWQHLIQMIVFICGIQLLFNFPKARMFAGDLGAYAFGFIIATLVILFFGEYPEFLTWQAILILFYPAWELVFTVIRRLANNKNPLTADRHHLHQLIFSSLQKKIHHTVYANALTTVILLPVIGFAFIWMTVFNTMLDLRETWAGIMLNLLLYLVVYYVAKKNND